MAFKKIKIILLTLGLFVIVAGAFGGYLYFKNQSSHQTVKTENKNLYLQFTDEVYDKIKENYWEKITDEQLANIYKLGAEKITSKTQTVEPMNKDGVDKMVESVIKDMADDKKKEFVASLSNIVVVNLKPFGRSQVLTSKQTESLVNTVNNKDPNTDLYATLGVDKNASQKEIATAYSQKIKELEPQKNTDAGKQKLAQIDRAFQTLSKQDAKTTYDQSGVETTVGYKTIKPDIFYLQIKKISPQTFDEFQKAANSTANNSKLKYLIVDLRGNIGGAVDTLAYFLGPFLGPNSYAYEFFHQGNYEPFKTKVGWLDSLVKFKKVVVLIDKDTQSSAEVMAAAIKKYNVGVLVGETTKGWGTIEQIMPLKTQFDSSEKYSLLIVQSLTISDDGQPIESRGVNPTISIMDKNWDKQLLDYFNYPPLIKAVKSVL